MHNPYGFIFSRILSLLCIVWLFRLFPRREWTGKCGRWTVGRCTPGSEVWSLFCLYIAWLVDVGASISKLFEYLHRLELPSAMFPLRDSSYRPRSDSCQGQFTNEAHCNELIRFHLMLPEPSQMSCPRSMTEFTAGFHAGFGCKPAMNSVTPPQSRHAETKKFDTAHIRGCLSRRTCVLGESRWIPH